MRHLVLKKKDYEVWFEYMTNTSDGSEFIIAHMDVEKYNKTIQKQIMWDTAWLLRIQELPVMVTYDEKDLKWLKFITMLGFVPAAVTDDEDAVYFIWKDV